VLEACQRPPTPLSILTLRTRLLLPKVRAFVDLLRQHWMRPQPPLWSYQTAGVRFWRHETDQPPV
jgi:hypothetical protein